MLCRVYEVYSIWDLGFYRLPRTSIQQKRATVRRFIGFCVSVGKVAMALTAICGPKP